jgi:thioredoxin reductase (NADPH)
MTSLASARQPVDLVGFAWGESCHRLRDLLLRNAVPYRWTDVETDPDEARARLRDVGLERGPFPVVVLPDGVALADPGVRELADALGAVTHPDDGLYDLVVVGAGPAGLAASVSAASEGLRTVMLEAEAPGGQAGSSTKIENYPGFPGGIRGAALADRMLVQARRFGAELVLANRASGIRREDELVCVGLEDEDDVRGRSVLLACGVAYRRLAVPGEERLAGRGVYYASGLAEAPELRDQQVVVVGGANAAGQAAVHLAEHACRVVLLVRGAALEEGMSQYLVDQIHARPAIEVRTGTSVERLVGRHRLEAVIARDDRGRTRIEAAACYVHVGHEPRTGWLGDAVALDRDGLVLTGVDVPDPPDPPPLAFEASLPGVFAAGDVRHGSVGRVAQAVGDGAASIPSIHEWLRRL